MQDNYQRLLKLPRGLETLNAVCGGGKTTTFSWWLWVLSVTVAGLMMCSGRCVPLQGMVSSTPGALQASSAHPAATAWVKSSPPSLHHPLEGTWEWEAASQTYELLSLHLAKAWCPHWWVWSTSLHKDQPAKGPLSVSAAGQSRPFFKLLLEAFVAQWAVCICFGVVTWV